MFARIIPRGRRGARGRRILAMAGVVLVLGVVMLDAHAALPEHHHAHGVETLCFASLAIATLAVAAWAFRARQMRAPLRGPTRTLARIPREPFRPTHRAPARAGPASPLVLRR